GVRFRSAGAACYWKIPQANVGRYVMGRCRCVGLCWRGSVIPFSAELGAVSIVVHLPRGSCEHAELPLRLTAKLKFGKLVFECKIVARCGVVRALVAHVVWRTCLAIGD